MGIGVDFCIVRQESVDCSKLVSFEDLLGSSSLYELYLCYSWKSIAGHRILPHHISDVKHLSINTIDDNKKATCQHFTTAMNLSDVLTMLILVTSTRALLAPPQASLLFDGQEWPVIEGDYGGWRWETIRWAHVILLRGTADTGFGRAARNSVSMSPIYLLQPFGMSWTAPGDFFGWALAGMYPIRLPSLLGILPLFEAWEITRWL